MTCTDIDFINPTRDRLASNSDAKTKEEGECVVSVQMPGQLGFKFRSRFTLTLQVALVPYRTVSKLKSFNFGNLVIEI